MKNKTWLCFPVLQAAALIQTASGSAWTDVLFTAVLAWLLLRIPRLQVLPEWLRGLRIIWNAFLIGQVLRWFLDCWPGLGIWTAAGLLLLSLWQTGKGNKAVTASASVLGLFQLALIGGVLAAGVQNIQLDNLLPQFPAFRGWLLTALLLPALGTEEKSGSLWPGLWALGISLVSGGVVPAGSFQTEENAFREMSRSLSVFGKIRRLESLAAVGLSLGFFTLLCLLLGQGNERGVKWMFPALAGFSLLLVGCAIPGNYAALISVVLWILLPALLRVVSGKS